MRWFRKNDNDNEDAIKKLSWQTYQQQEKINCLLAENEQLKMKLSLIDQKNTIGETIESLLLDKEKVESDIKILEKKKMSQLKRLDTVTLDGIGKSNLVSCGVYKSGEDFPQGKYDFYALNGKGTLMCTKGDIFLHMSKNAQDNCIRKYRNMNLPSGSRIEVSGDLQLLMYNSKPIKPQHRDDEAENIIYAGKYKIGEDICPGKYLIELKSGQGCIDDNDELYQKFDKGKNLTRLRVILKSGKTLTVDGDLEAYICEAKPLEVKQSSRTIDNCGVLCGGVYEAGIDIPYGYYDISLVSGKGFFELETINENRLNFYENFSKNKLKEYRNLLVEIGDKITVECGLEISLSRTKPYVDENISQGILTELKDVQFELKTLNNELVDQYYKFSDYFSITSEECKNKIVFLKQKEKELRKCGQDVVINDSHNIWGKSERAIRKILRTFNMECDNIMLNVGIKNIDKSRKNVQQSFETLNKLYSVDNVKISEDLLKLKLEQITLMYTYELKYQQEKDIQKAIKEQMMEEAKAEREIQEQKKKIEKDLQQHMGEINRLMKYMQKTQIDTERQLYIERIKELEDKIKSLEVDKETVLEREANAKAGFVYIISNIGSFGEDIYKIGMTRRLEPMDRVKELSSASVPFEFDVHAMIFSSDAPELETMLHRRFANRAVNKINPRKEFYKVDINEIAKVVKENYNDTVQFTKIPVATEYRQSLELEKSED